MSKVASKYEIPSNWHLNKNGTYDVEGDVNNVSQRCIYAGKLSIRFGRVTGNFYCRKLFLTTLEGCPKEVGGKFRLQF